MRSTSLLQKLLTCLLAGLICGETFLRASDKLLTDVLPVPAIFGISILIAICPLIYAIVLHFKKEPDDRAILNFWIGAIRYGIAFDLTFFGLQMLFHQQFYIPLAMLDEPVSSLSNQWLAKSYFTRSYSFVAAIGISQIIGSALIVFNRTRLLGSIFLLPVLLNIILIDHFYELDPDAKTHAWIIFAGVVYLIFIDYDRLLTFFLKHGSETSSVRLKKSNTIKYIGRLSIVVVPLLLVAMRRYPNHHPELRGRYHVTELTINDERMSPRNEADSILTRVYFDIANECVFEFNGLGRRVFGSYEKDGENITTNWHFPESMKSNPFKGSVTTTQDGVEVKGVMANDSIVAILKK